VGQDQHALVPPYRSLDNARGNDRLATTGRQHIQRSDGPLDCLDGLDLVVAQFAHGRLAWAKADAMVACTTSSPVIAPVINPE
jgi:hypothetical protein